MPNWTLNKVSFGDERVLKECLSEYKDGSGKYLDFDKILPMPKELDKYQAPLKRSNPEKAKEFLEKYGAEDWYNWRIENWGTKWLPSHTDIIDDYTIEFQTAWTAPVGVLQEISRKYHTKVEVEWADEGLDECGVIKFDNGEVTEDSLRDFEFGCEVWGFDPEEERKFRGE